MDYIIKIPFVQLIPGITLQRKILKTFDDSWYT